VLLRRLVRRTLERKGHRVSEAENGRSALELVRTMTEPPDLLLTDVVMPELGGLSLVRKLREKHPRLPVVVMSGYPDRGAEGDPAGLARDIVFLFKPFPPGVLLDALEDACARVR
jgi:CheY-like chemotaxis protein